MAAQTEPNSGLYHGWSRGESNWDVEVNANWTRLGRALTQLSVKDRDLTTPPASPTLGDRYLVPSGATGAWSGQTNRLAVWDGTAWVFYSPGAGWMATVQDEQYAPKVYDGSGWRDPAGLGASPLNVNDFASVSAALDAALARNRPLYFPAGTYTLTGWTAKAVTAPLVLLGEGPTRSIITGATATNFLTISSTLVCRGLKFQTWQHVFSYGAANVAVPLIDVRECHFDACNRAVTIGNNAAASYDQIRLANNRITNGTNIAFMLFCDRMANVWVTGNHAHTITSTTDKAMLCQAGANTVAAQDTMSRLVFADNIVENVHGGASQETHAVLSYMSQSVIANNVIRDLDNADNLTAAEAIYTKSRGAVIVGNTIIDGGTAQAYINIKGSARGAVDTVGGFDAVCVGNVLRETRGSSASKGIALQSDSILVANNIIDGVANGLVRDTDLASLQIVVKDNLLHGCTSAALRLELLSHDVVVTGNVTRVTGDAHGFILNTRTAAGTYSGWRIADNVLIFDAATLTSRIGISVQPRTGVTLDQLEISNNQIESKQAALPNGIYLQGAAADWDLLATQRVRIHGNRFKNVTTPLNRPNVARAYCWIRNNLGIVSEAAGQATITAAATSIAVSPAIAHPLNAGAVLVTPQASLGTATRFWVSGFTGNGFTINVDVAPGASVPFYWQVVGDV